MYLRHEDLMYRPGLALRHFLSCVYVHAMNVGGVLEIRVRREESQAVGCPCD